MGDDLFLTPQLRTGPSSRLLKRRSQLPPPQAQRLEVTNFAESMDVTSFTQRELSFKVMLKYSSHEISLAKIDIFYIFSQMLLPT